MELRLYQKKLIEEVMNAWDSGATNVVMQLSTGGGKTITFCEIIAQLKIPTIVIVHRTELVDQISLTLARRRISHNIVGQKPTIKSCVSVHMHVLGKSYYQSSAFVTVASVDTLLKLSLNTPWFQNIRLVVVDEAHHVLRENKWGRAVNLFKNARGLFPTATPERADGNGLGRGYDGLADAIVKGPPMSELISLGNLSDYTVIWPPNSLDVSGVNLTKSGDFNLPKLRAATREANITGDIVKHYKRFAEGKLGITFAVDISSATEYAANFRNAGIPAEVISSKTPALLRMQIMERFRRREILMLCNVDILGEGVDVPGVEVICDARKTASYGVYMQHFGRGLRPCEGKDKLIYIDHVENFYYHGPPDAPREITLARIEKKRGGQQSIILLRPCLECFRVYSRELKVCPYCGHTYTPAERKKPEHVDGDLTELPREVLDLLRAKVKAVDGAPRLPYGVSSNSVVGRSIKKNHELRKTAQGELRESISIYAGWLKSKGYSDHRIYRNFYLTFGIDILTAQTLNKKDAENLKNNIDKKINNA